MAQTTTQSLPARRPNTFSQTGTVEQPKLDLIPHDLKPTLTLKGDKPMATSLDVANVFDRQHYNVLRDIKSLQVPDDWHQFNFEAMQRDIKTNNGASRKDTYFLMTKDGFTLLVMGYTGERAMRFKLAYIEAFNKMEEELRAKERSRPSAEMILMKSQLEAIHAEVTRSGHLVTCETVYMDLVVRERRRRKEKGVTIEQENVVFSERFSEVDIDAVRRLAERMRAFCLKKYA